jgi:hypothetical protein
MGDAQQLGRQGSREKGLASCRTAESQESSPATYRYCNSRNCSYSHLAAMWLQFLDLIIPRIMHPVETIVVLSKDVSALSHGELAKDGANRNPLEDALDNHVNINSKNKDQDRGSSSRLPGIHSMHKEMYLNANRILLNLFTLLGILLTFGAVFPPLAAAVLCSMLLSACFMRLTVGRFLHGAHLLQTQVHAQAQVQAPVLVQVGQGIDQGVGTGQGTNQELGQEQEYGQGMLGQGLVDAVRRDCRGVGTPGVLQNSTVMLVGLSGCFYALFLFDTLGDAVGFARAYWVLLVLPLSALLLCATYLLYMQRWQGPVHGSGSLSGCGLAHGVSSSHASSDIEMSIFSHKQVLHSSETSCSSRDVCSTSNPLLTQQRNTK